MSSMSTTESDQDERTAVSLDAEVLNSNSLCRVSLPMHAMVGRPQIDDCKNCVEQPGVKLDRGDLVVLLDVRQTEHLTCCSFLLSGTLHCTCFVVKYVRFFEEL